MIGKKKANQIKSLNQKKVRQKEQLFLVEGDKNVLEVLQSHLCIKELIATERFVLEYEQHLSSAENITVVNSDDIKKASLLKNPQNSLALCRLPSLLQLPEKLSGISFYLDGIQDPGNLGTILRICDWFGMEHLFCSPDTADLYNPKVIQSSMGSFHRIKTFYFSHEDVFSLALNSKVPVIGTSMEGTSIYSLELPAKALIIMGSEGNGIRPEVAEEIKNKLSIPSFWAGQQGAESLNVAVAAGIIASEFKRQTAIRSSIQNGS